MKLGQVSLSENGEDCNSHSHTTQVMKPCTVHAQKIRNQGNAFLLSLTFNFKFKWQ